ncbi:hypothetical protein XELAEV_18045682mg [Xenopus laevis]|uniref:Uncharacterized protein n=1 Tax=Xenopus laevis TaxID=8355 RepID=A0A974C0Y8_XENLA|nr:hypothetical protein XELAEV_18045682mg [Xenopus laevis]
MNPQPISIHKITNRPTPFSSVKRNPVKSNNCSRDVILSGLCNKRHRGSFKNSGQICTWAVTHRNHRISD